jgi:type VII secretion-associated serine protease mycosin
VVFSGGTAAIVATLVVGAAAMTPAISVDTRDDQWHLDALKISEVHRISTGKGIIVGLVDSGVNPHSDLEGNVLPGHDVDTAGGDGRNDSDGHGTQMAGLIAARGTGGNDTALGIAPDAKILPVKAANEDNAATTAIAAAIEWAAKNRAAVINVSMVAAPSLPLQDAVKFAIERDSLIVAGAGNTSTSAEIGYPAAMRGVLAVGASDRADRHGTFSVTGQQIQLCAPGADIKSTNSDGQYVRIRGTSPATAIVSGAAALVRAKFPDLSAPEVIHRLTATADDIGPPGRDNECGFGIVNIVKALTADVPPLKGGGSPPAEPSEGTAAPDPDPAGMNLPLIIGGIGTAILLVGGLVAFLLVRRRKGSTAT